MPRTVGGKIMLGYLALCACLAGIGLFAFFRMTEISNTLSAYTRNLVTEMHLAQDISIQTMMVRLYAGSFVDTHNQASLNQFNTRMAALRQLLDEAPEILTEPERQRLARDMAKVIRGYEDGFREVIALIQVRQDREFRDLNAAKYRVERLLGSIRTRVSSAGDASGFLLLANAREAFSRMVLHSSLYLIHGDERDGVLFDNATTQLRESIDGLEHVVAEARHLENIEQAKLAVMQFISVMNGLRDNHQRQQVLLLGGVRLAEADIDTLVEQIVKEISGQVTDREQAASRFLVQVRHEILGALLAMLFVAMALSVLISRGIAVALKQVMLTARHIADHDLRVLSDNFKMLSTGNLQSELTITAKPLNIQRDDEVGRMAEAFDGMIHRLKDSETSFASMIAYLRSKAGIASDVAKGEVDKVVLPASPADALGIALKEMVAHLQASRDEVRRHQDQLTELVALRTSELEDSRRFLSNLLSNLPGMAYRRKNDAQWPVEFVSQGCKDLTGYDPAFFLNPNGAAFDGMVHPKHRESVWSQWRQAMETGRAYQLEYPLITATGRERWVLEKGLGVPGDDKLIVALEGFIVDISERKNLETQRLEMERGMLHAQKLESLGVLAGGIAHDFNNLLSAMLGNLELIMASTPPDGPTRKRLVQAETAARQAAKLTQQMLDYSGKGHFLTERVDLNRLVSENIEIFRTAIAKTINIFLGLSPEVPMIMADAGQVQQVVMNLITNASEAMEGRPGKMTLSTRLLKCDAADLRPSLIEHKPEPGWFVQLAVTDQGAGMDEETRKRLFDPFFTTKFTGRGLGLATVHGIVRGHRGAIMVDSIPGEGATFRILFPATTRELSEPAALPSILRPPSLPAPDQISARSLSPSETTILVVDDEAMVRETCVEVLHHLGYQTLEAVDGSQAVTVFSENAATIGCIILDLMMPKLDGMGAFDQLQRIRADIPVILCSGFSEEEAASRFGDRQPTYFLKKPYTIEKLRQALETIFTQPAPSGVDPSLFADHS